MAEINVEMLKEELYKVSKALFCIGEVCVDVSKQHISETDALNKIRGYLNDARMWSRFQVDHLIEDCMEPIVTNTFEEYDNDWLNKCLKDLPLQTFEINYPSVELIYPSYCDGCSNNPKNGGSGICNCTLPYMDNPTIYSSNASIDDCCMTATTSTGAYIFGKEKPYADKQPKADTNRITQARDNISKYIKRV